MRRITAQIASAAASPCGTAIRRSLRFGSIVRRTGSTPWLSRSRYHSGTPRDPACPVMRMADRHGQCVRGIGTADHCAGQQAAHHHLHLFLLGPASADDSQLHGLGGVFGHRHTDQCGRQQRHSPGVAQFQRRRAIAVDIGFLDRRLVRPMQRHQIGQGVMQHLQALWDAGRAVRGDHPIGNVPQAVAIGLDDAPTGEAQSRIDSEQSGHTDSCPYPEATSAYDGRTRHGRQTMSDELIFYTNPMSRGRVVRWMLEEVGQPYRTEILDYASTMKAPEYLAINPMGKVPALRHGDTVVTECAAICAYLADAFPAAGLAPPPGDPARGPYY